MPSSSPEQLAREKIDRQLALCGWVVQDYFAMDLSAGPGIAVREFPLKTGYADHLLYADGYAGGVIEAKHEGHPLVGVEIQFGNYTQGIRNRRHMRPPEHLNRIYLISRCRNGAA